jgi:hypothetical protein
MIKEKKGWPFTLCIIAAVVIVSAAIIYLYHDAPGRLPVSAVSDETDGIIISWQNDSGIYAQCIASAGQTKWQKGGMLITGCPHDSGFNLQADGLGGAIVTWDDRSNIPDDHDNPAYFNPIPIHAQRISAGGELLWSTNLVSAGREWQVVPDGTGGAIFAWDGYRTYSKALRDDYLRLQRIAPDGRRLWGDEGLPIVASSPFRPVTPEETDSGVRGTSTRSRPTYEGVHYIVTDCAGGVIILWEEDTGEEDNRVYARRLDNDGNYVWSDKVTTTATQLLSAESDGNGGVKIGTPQLTDSSAGMVKVYVHISGDGQLLSTSAWQPDITRAISDGMSGSFHIRVEERITSSPRTLHYTYYIQRFNISGQAVWPEKLLFIEEMNIDAVEYITDGTGGLIIIYQSQKDSLPCGINALRLDAAGAIKWGEEGTPVFNLPDIKYQAIVDAFSDGSGGAYIIAVVGKGYLSGDMVYVQRLDINGSRLWEDGIRIGR